MRKNKDKDKNNTVLPTNNTPTVNIVSSGTKVTGQYVADSDIRISGKIVGTAMSKGKIILTNGGVVQGKSISESADVSGRVEGEITVSNKLILRSSAVIDGDIRAKKLLVEEGAVVTGTIKMGSDDDSQIDKTDIEFANETVVLEKDGVLEN